MSDTPKLQPITNKQKPTTVKTDTNINAGTNIIFKDGQDSFNQNSYRSNSYNSSQRTYSHYRGNSNYHNKFSSYQCRERSPYRKDYQNKQEEGNWKKFSSNKDSRLPPWKNPNYYRYKRNYEQHDINSRVKKDYDGKEFNQIPETDLQNYHSPTQNYTNNSNSPPYNKVKEEKSSSCDRKVKTPTKCKSNKASPARNSKSKNNATTSSKTNKKKSPCTDKEKRNSRISTTRSQNIDALKATNDKIDAKKRTTTKSSIISATKSENVEELTLPVPENIETETNYTADVEKRDSTAYTTEPQNIDKHTVPENIERENIKTANVENLTDRTKVSTIEPQSIEKQTVSENVDTETELQNIKEQTVPSLPVSESIETETSEATVLPTAALSSTTHSTNSVCITPPTTNIKIPKISLIPLSRLIREELFELTEDNLNAINNRTLTTPNKLICKPNLVKRRRKFSNCSNSSSTTTEILVEKVVNMDKISIKNVINSSGTRYDEALKQQARKRLREEIRKQLKSMNLEQPKDAANTDYMPDDIVDALHIPDVVLDEIRKAFGIEICGRNSQQNVSEEQIDLYQFSDTNNEANVATGIEQDDFRDEAVLSQHLTESVRDNMGEPLATATEKDLQQSSNQSPKYQNPKYLSPKLNLLSSKEPEKQTSRKSPIQSLRHNKSATSEKRQSFRSTRSTKDNKRLNGVIVIDSSSSSSSTSSSSSSSSSSSDSDSDSNSSTHSRTSSAKQRRLKPNIDADTIVDSFEKLILLNLRENLIKRYRGKYSNTTHAKLHFISCICASKYNPNKFSKSEIGKIQRNLKAKDNASALNFLMREIVNIFHKFKQIAKSEATSEGTTEKLIKPQTDTKIIESNQRNDDASNRIETEVQAQQKEAPAIKSKSANAAEKLCATAASADDNARPAKSTTPTVEQHQSVNEQTALTKKGVCGKNAGDAKIVNQISAKEKPTREESFDDRNNKNCNNREENGIAQRQTNETSEKDDDDEITDGRHADNQNLICADTQRHWKSPGEKKWIDTNAPCSMSDYLSSKTNSIENIFATNMSSLLNVPNINAQQLNFPPVDLEALKQSPCGVAVISNLRDIDVQLLELHKRKMFIDEMILKLQKDKMEAELLAIKLQNEKFILLNTAMTANAAVATKSEESSASASATLVKAENVNTKLLTQAGEETLEKRSRATLEIVQGAETVDKGLATIKSLVRELTKTNANVAALKRTKRVYVNRKKKASPGKRRKTEKPKPNIVTVSDDDDASNVNETEVDKQNKSVNATTSTAAMSSKESSPQRVCNTTDQAEETLVETFNIADMPSGKLKGIKKSVTQIKIFEEHIIAASEAGMLYRFNARTLELENQFPKHSEAITQMLLCHEKKIIYTTSLDGYLKKSTIENFELDLQSIYMQEPLQSIDVEWGTAFIGSRWGNIFTYDTLTTSLSEKLLCSSEASIIAIKAAKEGPRKTLIVSTKGNLIHVRDATSGLLLRILNVPDNMRIYSLLLDLGCLYCGTQKREIYKFDFTTGEHLRTFSCGNGAVSMRMYKNKYLLVGCYDGYIYIIEKATGHQLRRFPGSGKMVLTLEIAGDKIITSAKDNTMEIIDIPSNVIANMTA